MLLTGESQLVPAVRFGASRQVLLDVQSGWLYDGAQIKVESIRAGYGDIQRDVLKNVSLTFEPRTKAPPGKANCHSWRSWDSHPIYIQ